MSMTVQQILDTVMKKYPHGYTNDDIILMLNNIQAELFRTIYKPITTTVYDITANNPFYPISFSPSKIVDVVVNNQEYPYRKIKGQSLAQFYYITEDNCIGIYPTPTVDIPGGLTVFRYKEPAQLSSSNLSAIPDFDPDFHMLLVFRVCKELAENDRQYDTNIVNGFISQINGLLQDFDEAKEDPDYVTIEMVYGEGLWS
jgi:hypothetical protein